MQTESRTAGAATCPHGMQTSLQCPVARPVALDEALQPADAIATWLSSRNADDFPYDAVVAEFHRVGKHVVATELLEALAGAARGPAGGAWLGRERAAARPVSRCRPGQVGWPVRQPDLPRSESAATARGGRPQPRHHRRRAAVRPALRAADRRRDALRDRRGGRRDGAAAADAAGCPDHRETLPAGSADRWAGRAASGIG